MLQKMSAGVCLITFATTGVCEKLSASIWVTSQQLLDAAASTISSSMALTEIARLKKRVSRFTLVFQKENVLYIHAARLLLTKPGNFFN
jgi:hypothetical protein